MNLRLRWTLYGPLPRCRTVEGDPAYGYHCWGLIWPWQRMDGSMHAKCRASITELDEQRDKEGSEQ